jgi:hypothetical protein
LAILGVHGSGQDLDKAYRRRGDQREAFQGRMDGGVKQPLAIADSDRSATGRRKVKGENGGVLRGLDQSKPHLLSTSPLRPPRVTYFARVVLDVLSQAASYGTFDFSSQGQFVPACWGRLTGMWLCPKQWCAANFAFRRSSRCRESEDKNHTFLAVVSRCAVAELASLTTMVPQVTDIVDPV